MTISGFIGDVKIDLSKAIIAEEESTIVISGSLEMWILFRRILKYVSASAAIGDMKLLMKKEADSAVKCM
ncbi:LiaF domain-containing protein [Bacillus sp. SL00103]